MKRLLFFVAVALSISLLFPNCAKVVSPSGGAKDTLAPVMIHSIPAINSTNFKGNKITFVFDEFIQLKDHQKKMMVSPPLKTPPTVTLKGKKIIFEFNDTLANNTTYTVYLGDAIEDNNERNKISNFEFAFSTGATIDSLSLKGKIIDAFTNKPVEGAIVMLYSSFEDSIPYKLNPMHVAKTNKDGFFKANNLKDIDYKIVSITDANGNYRYNQGSEYIGFQKDPIDQSKLLLGNDTTSTNRSQISIKLFMEELASQIITGYERNSKNIFSLFFSRKPVGQVIIKPLNFKAKTPWFIAEPDNNGDTLKYWVIDTTLYSIDTLKITVNYQKSDSLNQLHLQIDTLKMVNFNTNNDNVEESNKGGLGSRFGRISSNKSIGKKKAVNPMTFSVATNGEAKSGYPLTFTLPFPAKEVNPEGILILNETDSLMEPQVTLVPDKKSPVKYSFTGNWKPGTQYKMIVLPSTFITYDEKPIDSLRTKFVGADPENYGLINLKIQGFEKGFIADLLNEKGSFIERIVAPKNSTVSFKYIKPAKYKIRIIDDRNSNGLWDSGNYLGGVQPEDVFIYTNATKKQEINVRANWEIDIEFTKPSKK